MVVSQGFLRGMRILVAEDDWLEADTLCVRLEEQGAHVIGPFGRVADAIDALKAEKVDFALVDMVLKDRPADALIYELVRLQVRFGVITGYPALPTNAPETADLHVMKPVQWDCLWRALTPFAPR